MELTKKPFHMLIKGSDEELFEVLRESKSIWGAGVSLEEYVEYNALIRRHKWARDNFQHLVLVDENHQIFSSCKLYHQRVRIDSEEYKLCHIGAVFTPFSFRRIGYATQMLEHLIDRMREEKYDLALLFSDIGTGFYARLGFQLVEKTDPIYGLIEADIPPSDIQILNHLPMELLEYNQGFDRTQRFAIIKNTDYFQLQSDRISWHQRFLRYTEQKAVVSFKDKSYILADSNRGRIIIRRFGSLWNDYEQALGGLLFALKDKFDFNEISGWLPKEFEQYRFLWLKHKEPRTRTLMMFLALNEKAEKIYSIPPDELQFWLADYF